MNNNKISKLNNYEIANISGGYANDMLQAQPNGSLNATQILNAFCNSACGCERECSKSNTEAFNQGLKNGTYNALQFCDESRIQIHNYGYESGRESKIESLALAFVPGLLVGGIIGFIAGCLIVEK